jgi:type VI protein secretion system component Hcp
MNRSHILVSFAFAVTLSACGGGATSGGPAVPLQQTPATTAPGTTGPNGTTRYFNASSTVAQDEFICVPTVTTTATSCSPPKTAPTQWVEISSYSFQASVAAVLGTTTNGLSFLSPLQINKYADSTSPIFQMHLYSAKAITGDSRLIVTNSAVPYLEIDLKSAVVTADSTSGFSGGGVQEELSLNFAAFQYAYQGHTTSGLAGPIVAQNWDVVTHKNDYAPKTVLPAPGTVASTPQSATTLDARRANKKIEVPSDIVESLAVKANMSTSDINTILNGSLEELLTLPGIKGTLTPTSTQIEDFFVGAINSGKPNPEPLSYFKLVDVNSPVVWGILTKGAHYTGTPTLAELDLVNPTNITIKEGYFQFGVTSPESYESQASVGVAPQESNLLFYNQIRFCVVPFTNGKAGTPVCQGWNYVTHLPF